MRLLFALISVLSHGTFHKFFLLVCFNWKKRSTVRGFLLMVYKFVWAHTQQRLLVRFSRTKKEQKQKKWQEKWMAIKAFHTYKSIAESGEKEFKVFELWEVCESCHFGHFSFKRCAHQCVSLWVNKTRITPVPESERCSAIQSVSERVWNKVILTCFAKRSETKRSE